MKRFSSYFLFLCAFFVPLCYGQESATPSYVELKGRILDLEKKLGLASCENKSQIHFELAKAYHKDQEIDASFRHFLLALKTAKKEAPYVASEEEKKLYQAAQKDYFEELSTDPVLAAKDLLSRFGKIASEKKEFLLLNFFVSTAYANLGQYEDFFDLFYQAYPMMSDSFLAHKTQGILYLRLASRMYQEEEKNCFKEEAFKYLTLALEKGSQDSSLYKVLIFLAKEEQNEALLSSYLHKIAANRVTVPRGDIYLYVREAVSLEEYELAQKIIDHAKTIYEFSRVLVSAQEYLNQHRGL